MSRNYHSILNVLSPSFNNTYSLAFDGVDDRVQLTSDFVASGEFTISFWMKPSTISGNGSPYVIGRFPLLFNNYIKLDQLGRIYILINQTLVSFFEAVTGGGANNIVLNEWQNIIITRDSSNGLRCYRNGADYGYSGTPITNSNTLTLNSIGRNYSNTYGFQGSLDEVSFWNNDQTANISTISTSPVVDLTSLNPVAWYRMGDNGTWKSPQWLIPENSNVANSRFSNYSFEFDGVDDYIQLSSAMSTSGTDWSISCWFKSSQSGGNKIFVGFTGAYYFGLNWNRLTFISSDNSFDMISTSNMNDGNWHNIIYTYNYTTGAWKSYIDGVIDDNQTATTGVNIPAWQFFGARSSTQYFAECNLDEIAYFSTELTSENVTAIYNSGTITTLPVTPISHWKMGEEATFSTNWTVPDAVGSNDGTSANMTIEDRVGNAPNSTSNALSYNMTESDRETDVPS